MLTDALIKRFHITTISVCKIDIRERILETLASNEFYLQVKEELQKEHNNKKYEIYRLEEDGILSLQNRIYIPCDVCGKDHGSACNAEGSRKHNRNSDSAHNKDPSSANLTKAVLDEFQKNYTQ